jgi:predicted nucleic acid-binding protein
MKKVLIDSDIILDIATGREPFTIDSTSVLSLIECGYAIGTVSSNSVTNIYYILRKLSSSEKARDFLRTLLEYVSVLSVSHEAIRKAIDSKFTDLEDGAQHFCALENRCDIIITRNGKDYAFSKIEVLEPGEFVVLFDNT